MTTLKLTKLQAYEECEKMWRWLAKNPTKYKLDYFIGDTYIPENECWLCEYGERYIYSCSNCLGKDLWGECCVSEKSPYSLWAKTYKDLEITKYALIIADFCKMKIEELTSKKGKVRKENEKTN